MVTTEQQFIHFLKKNNAYEQFMFNFKIHRIKYKNLSGTSMLTEKNFFLNIFYRDFLSYAFFWKDTPQGYDYWCKLYYKWKNGGYNIKIQ